MMPLNKIIEQHIQFQLGTYISGLERIGDKIFHYSKFTDDMVWNRAPIFDNKQDFDLEWIVQEANSKNVPPAIAVFSPALDRVESIKSSLGDAIPERWMICNKLSATPNSEQILGNYKVLTFQRATEDFLSVFGNLFEDESINDFFKKKYNNALRNGSVQSGVECRHYVVYDEQRPCAVASIYIKDEMAGLYNVGVDVRYQKMGIGLELSTLATEYAFSSGAKNSILQCAVGSHVEEMYTKIGYKTLDKISVFPIKI